jgi:hypothetical protein
MLDSSTHIHLSFEVSHGCSNAFETGLAVVDIRSPSGGELSLGAGRGLMGGSEHRVAKSILGVPLTRRGA